MTFENDKADSRFTVLEKMEIGSPYVLSNFLPTKK